jgi:putative addiction module antidote
VKARITQIGNSTSLILLKEIVDRLKVQKGDEVFLLETKNGFTVTPYDPEFGE